MHRTSLDLSCLNYSEIIPPTACNTSIAGCHFFQINQGEAENPKPIHYSFGGKWKELFIILQSIYKDNYQ